MTEAEKSIKQTRTQSTEVSAKQLAANTANAAKSTGPRTDAGKGRSSQNAITHGAYSTSSIVLTVGVHREDSTALTQMIEEIVAAHAPRNRAEAEQARRVALAYVAQDRLDRFETATLNSDAESIPDGSAMDYETAVEMLYTALAYKHDDPTTWPAEPIDWKATTAVAQEVFRSEDVGLPGLLDDEHWPTTDDQWELVFRAIIAEKFPPPNDELENLKRTIAKEISVWAD